jgi:hypothetical protein
VYTDDDRRTLLEALEHMLGPRPAAILMGHLPPVGWVDLATRADIAELRSEVRGEIAELRGDMKEQFARMVMANVISIFAAASLVLAAASFVR